jgi:hypothetical protein
VLQDPERSLAQVGFTITSLPASYASRTTSHIRDQPGPPLFLQIRDRNSRNPLENPGLVHFSMLK